jgi:hypothetical protein
MRSLVFAVSLFALMTSRTARADDDGPPRREWFGYETLLADAPLVAAWASYPAWPGFEGDGVVLLFDIMAYAVIGPAIHMAHDSDNGGLSLALRLALPSVGMLVGFGIGASMPCSCASELFCLCGLTNGGIGAFAGMIGGAVLASLIDGTALAWARHEPKETHVTWSLTPFGVPAGGGLSASCVF